MTSKQKFFITGVACAALFLMININLNIAACFLHSLNELAEQHFGEFTGSSPFAGAQLSSLLMPVTTEQLTATGSPEQALQLTALRPAISEVSDSRAVWSPVEANLLSCQAVQTDAPSAKNKTGRLAQRKHSIIAKRIPLSPAKPASPDVVAVGVPDEVPEVVQPVIARITFDWECRLKDMKQKQRLQKIVAQELNKHEREFVLIRTSFGPDSE